MFILEDTVVLVTGGSRGIGFAITKALLEKGAKVAICGRDMKRLKEAEEKLGSYRECLMVMQADVSKRDQVENWVKNALEKFQKIDVLVNNAGVALWANIEDINDEDLDYQFNINLKGPLYCTQAVLPHLKEKRKGYIINISSIAGKTGFAGSGAYSVSKFGLMGLSDSLREEVAPYNIKVTAICPGYVATPLVADAPVPLEEMIRPEDIANTIIFLLGLSDRAVIKEIIIDRAEH